MGTDLAGQYQKTLRSSRPAGCTAAGKQIRALT